MRILVVDDNEVICNQIADSLKVSGFVVDTANDAQPAMTMMETNDYQLVVTDQNMGAISGITFFQTMRKRGCTTPFILMSFNIDEQNRKRYANKEFNGNKFLAVVDKTEPDQIVEIAKEIKKGGETSE